MARIPPLPKRRRMRAKRLDVTQVRRGIGTDPRRWATLALVVAPDGETTHYELVEEDGVLVDILVDVETVPDGLPLTCRLRGGAGTQGVWTIPNEGDEVVVVVPDGRIDFQPSIVAVMSSNEIPNPTDEGPAPARTVIVNTEVLVHDGDGGAVALALKSDVESLQASIDSHILWSSTHLHATAGVGPPVVPTVTDTTTTTDPVGTTVLKAK